MLAIFALVGVAYYLNHLSEKKSNIFIMVVFIIIGFTALSKTFILGLPLLLFVYFIYNTNRLLNAKWLFILTLAIAVVIIVVLNFDVIITKVYGYNRYMGYYLRMLKSPFDAFSSRYSVNNGILSQNYDLIKKNLIVGVGPVSVQGEQILDSAPIVILHNGGILALVTVLWYYFKSIIISIKYKYTTILYLLVVILASGFGLPIWVFHNASIGVIIYCCLSITCMRKNKI
jgi:hypothetical protein